MLFLQLPQNVDIPPDSVIFNKITENTQEFFSLSWHDKLTTLIDGSVNVGLKLLAAVIVFIACRWLIKRFDKLIDRIFVRRGIDSSLNTFVRNMLRIVGYIILIMIVVSIVGIRTTSFVALLASMGFAVGMALSGTLQNFAGGMMILLLKPFRTGDYISAQGYEGTVKEIKLFNTIIITSDNKTVIIPNGGLSTGTINNFTQTGTRRVEWVYNISYGDNYDTAKALVEELLRHDKRVMDKPPFFIALQGLAESSVNIIVRAWTSSDNYWDVFFDMNEKVYKIFPEHGLSIPYNALDVTIHNADDSPDIKKRNKKPSAASIKQSVKNVGVNNTGSEENSITREDIDFGEGGCRPTHTDKNPDAR